MLAAGLKVDDYKVIRLLGKGGMGEVYLAEDVKLGRKVALKLLPADVVADPARQKRFAREAKAVSMLSHPNIVFLYGFGECEAGAYIAMEFVEGESLAQRLAGGKLGIDEFQTMATQIAEGLAAAHEKKIIHRDLKPGNIMITPEGRVKLLDFGLAKLRPTEVTDQESTATMSMATEAGAVLGTVSYMSPEQAQGKEVDERSDVFALGAVLYEMTTGRRAFTGANSVEVVLKIVESSPEPIARWNYDVPGEIERIIRKCLEKDRENRYQSARDVLVDLRNFGRDSSMAATSRAAVRPPMPRRKWIYAAGTAGAVGTAAIVWRQFRNAAPESVAVLPFRHEGPPDAEVLAEGLTEGVINSLGASTLRVIARSAVYRFKPTDDPYQVARTLNAESVLTGSVTYRDAAHISLSAELAQVKTADQLWGKRLEVAAGALALLPEQIASEALERLGIRRPSTVAGAPKKVDPVAYQLHLKGRYYLNRRTAEARAKAIEFFKQAIDADPTYSPPWAGLADVYVFQSGAQPPKEVFPRAIAAARKALELDPALADAHASLAFALLHHEWDWARAESECLRAIQLNPSYPSAHSYYGRLLSARKRFAEALDEVRRAEELDPLSPSVALARATTYYLARRFDEAVRQLQKMAETDPRSAGTHGTLAFAYLAQGRHEQAIGAFEKCLVISPNDTGAIAALGFSHAANGNREKGLEALSRLNSIAQQRYVAPYFFAVPHAGLGDRSQALDWLDKAFEDRSWPMAFIGVEPILDVLRAEPRFRRLLDAVGA